MFLFTSCFVRNTGSEENFSKGDAHRNKTKFFIFFNCLSFEETALLYMIASCGCYTRSWQLVEWEGFSLLSVLSLRIFPSCYVFRTGSEGKSLRGTQDGNKNLTKVLILLFD